MAKERAADTVSMINAMRGIDPPRAIERRMGMKIILIKVVSRCIARF